MALPPPWRFLVFAVHSLSFPWSLVVCGSQFLAMLAPLVAVESGRADAYKPVGAVRRRFLNMVVLVLTGLATESSCCAVASWLRVGSVDPGRVE